MKIVFMGTPKFAVPTLKAIINTEFEMLAVFTQPDKPKNRGHKIGISPVKEFALKCRLPLYQPMSLRKGECAKKSLAILRAIEPDCIVVAAYGQILSREILEIPKYGCINVHASLLPRYRGASPINSCIINGDSESGVTIMKMEEGLDTGDMIISQKVDIPSDMTASALHDILMNLGADLTVKTLLKLKNNTAAFTPQDNDNASYANMINKKDCLINWKLPAGELYNKIRGLSESPTAYTFLGTKRLKIYFSKIGQAIKSLEKPGTIINTKNFEVLCGNGETLILTDIQLEGSARMSAESFLRGKKLSTDIVLGE